MIRLGCKLLILFFLISNGSKANDHYEVVRDSLLNRLNETTSEDERLRLLTHLCDIDFLQKDSAFILPCWNAAVKQKDYLIMDGIAASMFLRYYTNNNSDSADIWLQRTQLSFEGEWLESNLEFIQLLQDIRSFDQYDKLSQQIRTERINITPRDDPYRSMRILYNLALFSSFEAEYNPAAVWKSPREYLEQALQIAEQLPYRVGSRFKMQILMALSNYDLMYAKQFLLCLDTFYAQPDVKARPFYSKKPAIIAYDKLISVGDSLPEEELREYYLKLSALVEEFPSSAPVRTDYFKLRMNFNFYKALGKTDSSLIYCDSLIMNDNPAGNNKIYLYEYKSKVLGEQQRWKDAYQSAMVLMDIRDSLAHISSRNALAELQAQYEVDDAIQLAEHKKRQLLLFTTLIALLIVSLIIFAIRSRRYRIKNRILLVQLNDYAAAIKNTPLKENDLKETEDLKLGLINPAKPEIKDMTEEMPKSQELTLLFEKLDQLMRMEKKYADPALSREVLTSELGVNRNKLSEAVFQATGKTINDYIVSVRLNEALLLIKNDPKIALTEVADKCGFGTYSTFYRSFFKCYGVKPAEYKKYLTEE